MRIHLTLFLSCISSLVFSQGLRVSMDYGFGIGEMEDAKRIVLHTGFRAGAEFSIGERNYLSFMAGSSVLRFNYSNGPGESIFNRKFFLMLPVSIKRYYPLSKRSSGFVEVGIYASFNLFDRKETRNSLGTTITRHNNPGKNGGGVLGLGFKTMITNRISFDVGLSGQKDFFDSYKQDQYRIRAEKTSLSFGFYRKI
ncbi:MAG: hypothetical protein ABIR30_03220 [Chitinophagaceae bacterium]